MYIHARKFPHLAGKSMEEIRSLARNGMQKRPYLIRIMRIRNSVILGGMLAAVIALRERTSLDFGLILMIVGGAAFTFVICWNVVWLNTVIYRITQPDSGQTGIPEDPISN